MPAPQHCPSQRELDDLELLLSGALAPLANFGDVSDPGITLSLPPELADSPEVELVDPEGLPLALWSPERLIPLAHPAYGPFRRLHLTPAEAKRLHDGALVVPVAAPLTDQDLALVTREAAGRDVVLLALNGTGTPQDVTPVGLVRATLAAAQLLGDSAHVVAAPLPSPGDADYDHELGHLVAANYATAEVVAVTGEGEWPAEI
ncbi:MAG: adenylyl-sulfate kinase, partial [Marmoricola sp.]